MIKHYIKLLRISHWIKNSFVFVPLIFAELLWEKDYLLTVILAAFAFSVVSSMIYVFNDIVDVESDREHPQKKFRPLASGVITIFQAKITIIILMGLLSFLVFLFPLEFNLILISYIILNVLYSLVLKNIVILDMISISIGFLLRVVGGAYVIGIYISSWLILTTLFISLYLAAMKRRSELVHTTITSYNTRKVLEEYSLYFIDQISAITAGGVIISYALYSVSEHTVNHFQTENLVFTTIFVIFGIFRYMYLVFKKHKGENTVEILLTDVPLIVNIVLYIITVTLIIYF